MVEQVPLYNLSAVLNETGLKADVLRAWERRYGLPEPQRSRGGHRLYTPADVQTIKWLQQRQAEGLSISRAVNLWRQLGLEGHDPMIEYPLFSVTAPVLLTGKQKNIDQLREAWLAACLVFDDQKAEHALNQAFALYPVEAVCTSVLQLGLRRIGEMWYMGSASVQQEHFASSQATRRLEALISAAPIPSRAGTIMLICPEKEAHIFPILLTNLLLRRRGWKVVYLGADIPLSRLEETTATVKPDLVVLAAQQLTTAAGLQSIAHVLVDKGNRVGYGGLIFNRIPALRERIPAFFLGETLEGAVPVIENLLTSAAIMPHAAPLAEELVVLMEAFRHTRPFIELDVRTAMSNKGGSYEYIDSANLHFGDGLCAALSLGDPGFMTADMDWVTRLISGRRLSALFFHEYLQAFKSALQASLGETSAPIIEFINSYDQGISAQLSDQRSTHG